MSFQISQPSLDLSAHVKQYWAMDNVMPGGQSHTQRIIPVGLVELTIYLGDKPLQLQDGQSASAPSLLTGQLSKPYDLVVSGTVSVFSITFHPQGAQMFFDIPMNEICDQTISLRHVQKDLVDRVETDLYEATSFSEKVTVMNLFLGHLLRAKKPRQELPRLMDSIRMIDQSMGLVDIDMLARRACLSRKQFERIFKAGVGISPKRFLRIIRFQHAIFKKQTLQKIPLTELAYECGYYDQSHMINDFKFFTGMSPKQYFSACDPYSDYFLL